MNISNAGVSDDSFRCIFCNLAQSNPLFPARLNRFGPIPAETRKSREGAELNGGIFRPYLSSEDSTSASDRISPARETKRRESEAEFADIGHSKRRTLQELVDKYGIFWAHDACLYWSRNPSSSKEDNYWNVIETNLSQVRYIFTFIRSCLFANTNHREFLNYVATNFCKSNSNLSLQQSHFYLIELN